MNLLRRGSAPPCSTPSDMEMRIAVGAERLPQSPTTATLWPMAMSRSMVACGMRRSTFSLPGRNSWKSKDVYKCALSKRGASMASCGDILNSTMLRKTWSNVWSCKSPPGVDIARNGLPSFSTIKGLSVTRGRLPGANWLGWPGVSTNVCMRSLIAKPVSPAITEGSQPPLGVDQLAPLRRIVFRKQSLLGNLGKLRIAVVAVAIGKSQLDGFHESVNVRRTVVAHGPQVVALQQVQGLDHHRTLRPEAGLEDFIPAIGAGARRIGLGMEAGHVVVSDQAAVALAKVGDLVGDRARVKVVADRLQTLGAVAFGFGFGAHQRAQSLR